MHPIRRSIAWFQAHPFVADALLAAAVTAITLPSVWSTPIGEGDTDFRDPDVLGVVLLVLSSSPIAWRRRSPFPTLVVVGTAAVAYEALGYATQFSTVGVLIALYTAAAHLDRRRSVQAALFTAVGLAIVLLTARWEVTIGSIASNIVIFATVWLIGDNLQTRRANVAALRERAERAEQTRAAEAQRAVAEERTRIARELHDVVAHSVSVMLVQTGAARRVIDTDPAQAAAALEAVEATGREAMAEMRRLLGVLREDGGPTGPAALAPQPSLRELPTLIAHVAESGLVVTLATEGAPRDLPAAVGLSAYRIVQEALTNALKHAGPSASAVVSLRYREDEVEIEVADDGRGASVTGVANGSRGHGLLGMRERAGLFGGELTAGPRAGGGFVVRARLPISEAAVG
jgi:signal transduction histidine kinase